MDKLLFSNTHRKFERRGVMVNAKNEIYAMDLIDLTSKNAGYILNIMDVFSRYLWSFHLKNKNKIELEKTLTLLFNNHKPKKIWSDLEPSLVALDSWLKSQGIERYATYNGYDERNSVPIVERLNRTMRDYFNTRKQEQPNQNYKQLTHFVVNNFPNFYNNKVHSTLKKTPAQVYNSDINNDKIRNLHYENYTKPRKQIKTDLTKGDKVLLQKPPEAIRNKFDPKFFITPLKIEKRINTNPITFKLEGKNASYYPQQLKRTSLIDKIKAEPTKKKTIKPDISIPLNINMRGKRKIKQTDILNIKD